MFATFNNSINNNSLDTFKLPPSIRIVVQYTFLLLRIILITKYDIKNNTIKCITEDIERFQFNTCIARIMEYVNSLSKLEKVPRYYIEQLLLVLAPFAPHISEELWNKIFKMGESNIDNKLDLINILNTIKITTGDHIKII